MDAVLELTWDGRKMAIVIPKITSIIDCNDGDKPYFKINTSLGIDSAFMFFDTEGERKTMRETLIDYINHYYRGKEKEK